MGATLCFTFLVAVDYSAEVATLDTLSGENRMTRRHATTRAPGWAFCPDISVACLSHGWGRRSTSALADAGTG